MKVNLLWCSPQALQSSGAMILAILLGIEPCMAEDFKVQQPQLLEVSELFSLKGSEAQLVVLDSDLQNEVSDDPQTGVKSSLQTMAELKPKSVDHPQDWGVIASGDAPYILPIAWRVTQLKKNRLLRRMISRNRQNPQITCGVQGVPTAMHRLVSWAIIPMERAK